MCVFCVPHQHISINLSNDAGEESEALQISALESGFEICQF